LRKWISVSGPIKNYLVLLIFLAAGCQERPYVPESSTKMPRQMAGTSDKSKQKWQAKIQQQGVQFLSLGQDHLISIQAGLLFSEQSPALTWDAYKLLNDIACYLKQFRKISVNVVGFVDPYISAEREHALTLKRARVVGSYLWSQGITSRFIFTEGVGADRPKVAYRKLGDVSQNARIEITFRHAAG